MEKQKQSLIIALAIIVGLGIIGFALVTYQTRKNNTFEIQTAILNPNIVEANGYFTVSAHIVGNATDVRAILEQDNGEVRELILTNTGKDTSNNQNIWSERTRASDELITSTTRIKAKNESGEQLEKAFPETKLEVSLFTRSDLDVDSFSQRTIEIYFRLINNQRFDEAYSLLSDEMKEKTSIDKFKDDYKDMSDFEITSLETTHQDVTGPTEEDKVNYKYQKSIDSKTPGGAAQKDIIESEMFFQLTGDIENLGNDWKINRISQTTSFPTK